MIAPDAGLSISRQCTLLGVARSSLYYRPRPESAEELEASEAARPNAARVFVPGRDNRLGNPPGAVLAAVKHADGEVLCRVAERNPRPVRQARHLQYRSRGTIHQR